MRPILSSITPPHPFLNPLFHFSANELAVILSNRSAALYHLGRNELALRDMQRALDLGYPSELEYKIRERQARCHMANKNAYEAMEAFKWVFYFNLKIQKEKKLLIFLSF